MFNLGFTEIILIAIIALVFLGPQRLPEFARSIGEFLRDLKKSTNEVTDSLQREVKDLNDERNKIKQEIEDSVSLIPTPEESSIEQNDRTKKS